MSAAAMRTSALTALRGSLDELRERRISTLDFARRWRSEAELLAALPLRFGQALEQILQRLESGSLFAEESCSFSQTDLHNLLEQWLDKAQAQLADNTDGAAAGRT
jgi:hypothetical protein